MSLRFTKDHEWIKVDGKIGTVGITQYAQAHLFGALAGAAGWLPAW